MKRPATLVFTLVGVVCVVSSFANAKCLNSYHSELVTNEVNRILKHAGVNNIKALASNETENAAATMCRGERVVYVNEKFLNQNNLSLLEKRAIMAHEVGHHVSGHILNNACSHREELQADYYAGFILYRMGVSRKNAVSVIMRLDERPSICHPGRERRKQALEVGWYIAEELVVKKGLKYYSRLSHCMTSDRLPGEHSFKERYQEGQQLIAINYGPPDPKLSRNKFLWCLVFHPAPEELVREIRKIGKLDDVRRFFRDKQKQGYRIDRLRYYGNAKYVMIMEKTEHSSHIKQRLTTHNRFPDKAIREGKERGLRITDISYRSGKWILVMSEAESNYEKQIIISKFPSEKAMRSFRKKYVITNIAKGPGGDAEWVIVLTKWRNLKANQKVFESAFFPDLEILYHTMGGFHVTAMEYHHGMWTVVMTECYRPGLGMDPERNCAKGFNGMR